MNVKLVSITQATAGLYEGAALSPEELIVFIARVSNPSNQLNTATSDKLIRYMIEHKHWSPFDMVNMTVEVKTSRAIAHQILRHWSIKPQEFSQRYASATSYEPISLRVKADKNRQSSSTEMATIYFKRQHDGAPIVPHFASVPDEAWANLAERYGTLLAAADELYRDSLQMGVAAECARFILPLATQTTMYLNGSVRSWIHYMQQRCDEHAQSEHRAVAFKVRDIFNQQFPNIALALENDE